MPSSCYRLQLLAVLAIYLSTPTPAGAEPALYRGAIELRLWERGVPYGESAGLPRLSNPAAGSPANLLGTGPAAFTFDSGQMHLATSLADFSPTQPSLDWLNTDFSGANGPASFFGGVPTAPTDFAPLSSIPASQFGVSFAGGQGFGGVMQLLGRFDWKGELAGSCGYCPYHTVMPLTPIGGPFGGTATATTYVGGTAAPPTFVTATVWGFPWRTGHVGGVAAVEPTSSSTTTSANGMDGRTPSGLGTLQLVTPFLIRVRSSPPDCAACERQWFYAGSARARFRFAPEAGLSALLTAGLIGLSFLYHRSHRSKRRAEKHTVRTYRSGETW